MDIHTWQKILSVRGLLLSKAENMEKFILFFNFLGGSSSRK